MARRKDTKKTGPWLGLFVLLLAACIIAAGMSFGLDTLESPPTTATEKPAADQTIPDESVRLGALEAAPPACETAAPNEEGSPMAFLEHAPPGFDPEATIPPSMAAMLARARACGEEAVAAYRTLIEHGQRGELTGRLEETRRLLAAVNRCPD